MKLHIYDHCPFCVRPRMALGLKHIPCELSIIMEGDVETPTRMIGKKMVPILEKDDGTYMGESLDIVHYIDQQSGELQFAGDVDPRVDAWIKEAWSTSLDLFIPRFTQGEFAELATPEAREAYLLREQKAFGDLDALRANTPALVAELEPKLQALVPLIKDRHERDITDIVLWPILRCLSIVKALPFPQEVLAYTQQLGTETGVPLLFDQAR